MVYTRFKKTGTRGDRRHLGKAGRRAGTDKRGYCSLEGEIPFHEMMTLDEAKEFDMAQTEAILEDLTVRMINARKLNIRALVEIKVCARERVELNIPVAIDSEYPLEELHNTEVYLELWACSM